MRDHGDSRRLLFTVPIRRLSEKAFYKEQNALMAPHIENLSAFRSETEAWSIASQVVKWYAWDFNDLVGRITLHGYHDMVKMYLWWTTARQIRRGGRHVLECEGKLTETFVYPEMSSEETSNEVREALVTAFREQPKRYRSRDLDLRTFDAVSPFLDWHAALGACEDRGQT